MSTPAGKPDLKVHAEGLLSFLHRSPTPYHAARSVAERLRDASFQELSWTDRWAAEPGGKYLIPLGDGAMLAVRVGTRPIPETGAVVLAAHTDSPALRVKEKGASWKNGYLVLPTEVYGGPILSTWLDRDLGIAGRCAVRDGRVIPFRLPLTVTIPNLAIHLNRKINEGFEYNPQDHLGAVVDTDSSMADGNAEVALRDATARAAGVAASEIVEMEMLLFDPTPGSHIGERSSLLAAPRIDNLAACYANTSAFTDAAGESTAILALFNHEEVGSLTGEGAQSDSLVALFRRLVGAAGGDWEDTSIALARSLIVSNDAAHGLHPGYKEKHDSDYAPVLGAGPVLKLNGSYRYATTAATAAEFAMACENAGVPLQRQLNRSDIKPGSTVGPVSWARTGIPTVDVGIPILAMHSLRETAGADDTGLMIAALGAVLAGRGER